MGTGGTRHARIESAVRAVQDRAGRRARAMSARSVGRRWATIAAATSIAVAFVIGAAAIGSSGPPTTAGGNPQDGALPPVAGFRPPAIISYGLAEPAGSLPGAETPADAAAWSQIRADVVGSGACWLRSDLDSWLARAIQAFDWLGSRSACLPSAGSPVKVLAILDSQTVWAARRLCPDATFSASYGFRRRDFTLDDWRQIVRCVAHEFAGRISAYEIWNEPLLSNSILGYEDGSAAHYFDLLRVAYAEIKAADPAATVLALGGSDVYAGGEQDRLAQMRAFSTDLVAMGARQFADAISLHAYPWGRFDDAVWTSYRQEVGFQEGTWGKPVWITETGQRATDSATQTDYMNSAYSVFEQAGVGHLFWFSITDQPDGAFGMRGRPIEAALKAFALGSAGGGDLGSDPPGGIAAPDGGVGLAGGAGSGGAGG